MITLYKANKRKTGSLISFTVNSKGQCVHVGLVKQTDWNEEKRTGRFQGDKLKFKLNPSEIAQILFLIDENREHDDKRNFYHSFNGIVTQIYFKKWRDSGDKHVGWSISVYQKKTEGNISILAPLTFSEARLLYSWFEFALNRVFTSMHQKEKEKRQEYLQSQSRDSSAGLEPDGGDLEQPSEEQNW